MDTRYDILKVAAVPLTIFIAGGIYNALRTGIPRSGTALGKATQAQLSQRPWLRRFLPLSAAIYVVLIGLLISFGTVTPEAMLIGCPAVAIGAAYLVKRFRPDF